MVYASSGSMKCFDCGDVGHKRFACPHRQHTEGSAVVSDPPIVAAVVEGESSQLIVTEQPELGGNGAADTVHTEQVRDCVVVGLATPTTPPGEIILETGKEGAPSARAGEGTGATSSPGVEEAEPGQASQASSSGAVSEPLVESQGNSEIEGEGDGEDDDDMSDMSQSDTPPVSETSAPQSQSSDLYTLEDVNDFLDKTYNKRAKIADFFSDKEKFIRSVGALQRVAGLDVLDEKKRARLRKLITALRRPAGSPKSRRVIKKLRIKK